jgi:DNA repair exonuclease SbcCD ATPase subunit
MLGPLGLPELGGNVAQWIIAISSTGILALLARSVLQYRGQSLDSEEKIRDHYAREVARLSSKLDEQTKGFREDLQSAENFYRGLLSQSDEQHEKCRRECEECRGRLRELEKTVDGLQAQIRRYSTDKLLILHEDDMIKPPAPHAVASAKRMKRDNNKNDGDKPMRDEGDIL